MQPFLSSNSDYFLAFVSIVLLTVFICYFLKVIIPADYEKTQKIKRIVTANCKDCLKSEDGICEDHDDYFNRNSL